MPFMGLLPQPAAHERLPHCCLLRSFGATHGCGAHHLGDDVESRVGNTALYSKHKKTCTRKQGRRDARSNPRPNILDLAGQLLNSSMGYTDATRTKHPPSASQEPDHWWPQSVKCVSIALHSWRRNDDPRLSARPHWPRHEPDR
jgi:hypothetical protein